MLFKYNHVYYLLDQTVGLSGSSVYMHEYPPKLCEPTTVAYLTQIILTAMMSFKRLT